MTGPSTTVVVPTYRRVGFLRQAVRSVLDQTRGDFRLLVCDNASDDGTADFLAGVRDARVEVVRHPHNLGAIANFNEGLARVRTPFATVLLDDDVWDEHYLERVLPLLESSPRIALAHTAFRVVDEDGRVLSEYEDWHVPARPSGVRDGAALVGELLGSANPVMMSSAIFRTDRLPAVPFDPRDVQAEDVGLWLRLVLGARVAFVADPLTSFRRHAGSSSVSAALTVPGGTVPSFVQARQFAAVRLRFLDEYEQSEGHGALTDLPQWRRAVWRRARTDVLGTVSVLRDAGAGPAATARLLAEASREVPQLSRDPRTWRLLAAAVLPRSVRRRLRTAVAHANRSR